MIPLMTVEEFDSLILKKLQKKLNFVPNVKYEYGRIYYRFINDVRSMLELKFYKPDSHPRAHNYERNCLLYVHNNFELVDKCYCKNIDLKQLLYDSCLYEAKKMDIIE